MTFRADRISSGAAEGTAPLLARPWLICAGLSLGLHAAAVLALAPWSEPVIAAQAGRKEVMSIQVGIVASIDVPQVTALEEPREAPEAEAAARDKPPEPSGDAVALLPQEEPAPAEKPEEIKTASTSAEAMAHIEAVPVAAGASTGEVQVYGREVSVALARSLPKAKGQKGKVTLAFVLDLSGRIARLDVVSPSGNVRLDEAAMDAVRKAVFPPPPPDMSETQRTYVIPFRFR